MIQGDTSIESVVSEAEKDEEGDDWQLLTLAMRLAKKQTGMFECISEYKEYTVSNYTYHVTVQTLGKLFACPVSLRTKLS